MILLLALSLFSRAEYYVDYTTINGKPAIVVEYDNGLTKTYLIKDETAKTMDAEKIFAEACHALQLKNCRDN